MRKWLSLLTVLFLAALLTACGEKTPKDTDILAEVGKTKITREEANPVLNFMLKYQESVNGEDAQDTLTIALAKAEVLDSMTRTLALEQKLVALGEGLTEEDEQRIESMASEVYGGMVRSYADTSGATMEEATQAAAMSGITLEVLRFFSRTEVVETKLRDMAPISAEVTDEEIVEAFDLAVQNDMQRYAQSPDQFCADSLDGKIIVYHPEGYRYIQNLIIAFPGDIEEQISQRRSQTYNIGYNQYMFLSEMEMYDDQMTDADREAVHNALTTLDTEYARLMDEIEELAEQGRALIRADAERILAECQVPGADFEALMDTYSADPASGSARTLGYPVSESVTRYVEPFTAGAMALAAVGDISGLIETEYGFHIIKYAGDVPAGPIPLDRVREDIREALLEQKTDEAYAVLVQKYLDEAKIKKHLNKF
ncbi:MAG: peptidylprolyl isomerase [Clostridia bacterium]|nr:peptidylprolyl isomerase [Clostridia bacterium]